MKFQNSSIIYDLYSKIVLYENQKIFKDLKRELDNNKILLLVWPRQIGKTTLLEQLQSEVKDKQTSFITFDTTLEKVVLGN